MEQTKADLQRLLTAEAFVQAPGQVCQTTDNTGTGKRYNAYHIRQ